MNPMNRKACQIKLCSNSLEGGADVGVMLEAGLKNIKVCARHAYILMTAPRGTYTITEKLELKPIPAKKIIT